jgi:hypothetical protein
MNAIETLRHAQRATARSVGVFARDVGHGLLEVSHNTLALLGLGVVAMAAFGIGQADLRTRIEEQALQWLQGREVARALESGNVLAGVSERSAVSRATAIDPSQLTGQQAAVAQWIARRYKVAPEPVSRLVQEAWSVGQTAAIDPTLILAIMAIESSFNPFAQSAVGAQGLMQVMTRVHDDKYVAFGGTHAAFDPVTNLRVGVQVLKDCIARAGSLQDGLRYYVGAASLDSDGGYAERVLSMQETLRTVAVGKRAPLVMPPLPPANRQALPAAATTASAPGSTADPQIALLH